MKIDRTRPWPTPVLVRKEVLQSGLIEDLLKLIREDKSKVGRSATVGVRNATKSAFELLPRCVESGIPLGDLILTYADLLNHWLLGDAAAAVADDMVAEAWAVTYKESGIHQVHAHHDSAWSGVIYLKTEMAEGSGLIEFIDPRHTFVSREESAAGNTYAVDPKVGTLVMFPSWLSHWVTPVRTESERISVAFNVGFSRESA